MRYRDGRRSVCVSSQSGCPLTCTFCATGAMRFGRNLTASEILDQALHFRRIEPVDHFVFMGMGEPMLNLDARPRCGAPPARPRDHAPPHDDLDRRLDAGADALRRRGRGADPARVLAARGRPTRCAAGSCPSTTATRSRTSLAECERYFALRRRKVFVEYVMLAGVNDRVEQARQLADAARPARLQGQPDPVQPDRRVRRLVAEGDRRVQGRARRSRACPRPCG